MKWLSCVAIMAAIAVFVFTGCQQTVEKRPVLGPPDPELINQAPAYVTKAAEAAGGWRAWTKIQQLGARCVVTFYDGDGSFYLTQQCHRIQPWLNSITITATGSHTFPGPVTADCYAQAVLEIVTAPARFLDSSAVFTRGTSPVKIEGLWYYPIERVTDRQSNTGQQKVVFYQNTDTSLVDIISFVSDDKHSCHPPVTVRAYDYHQIQDQQVMLPARLEIFRTDHWGQPGRRLVKIDFETWSLKQYSR